ncbi:MAG: hypothetical protein MUF71_11705 [Candidatus Kapabacteria bacterium]|jgi:fibronectin type 3 domain-containing protein|nr:hypothetical protein [Candidatus Kapabacteria bacterium]
MLIIPEQTRLFTLLAAVVMFFHAVPIQLTAQQQQPLNIGKIAGTARSSTDSIILRWGVSSALAWRMANDTGYVVERLTLDSLFKPVPNSLIKLTPQPIKPWSLAEWKSRATARKQEKNTYAAIATQMLYGKIQANTQGSANNAAGGINLNAVDAAATEFQTRFAYSLVAADNDAFAAEGLALRLVDTSVRAGESYTYRVFIPLRDKAYAIDTAYIFARAEPFQAVQADIALEAKAGDGSITVKWSPTGTKGYAGFFLYRADKANPTFKRLNTAPLLGNSNDSTKTSQFTDTTITNYKLYRYRLTAITAFADETLPLEVATFGRDLTPPPAPTLDKPEQTAQTTVKLKWSMPKTLPKDLAGFVVMRSSRSLEGFKALPRDAEAEARADTSGTEYEGKRLPATAREFTDTDADEEEPYYAVVAVDTAGNRAHSFAGYVIMRNMIPIAAPKGLAATIDSLGVVRLRWNLGEEKAIAGYRVFRANNPTQEFSLLTGDMLRDTVFTDTISLNTLTKSVFYRVAAVDKRYVVSQPSRILTVKRPDIVPPLAPMFTSVIVRDTAVSLAWQPSASDDVSYQALSRRVVGASWQLVKIIPPFERTYNDASITQQTEYEYRIIAVDSAGLRSEPSMIVKAHTYEQGLKQSITNLKAKYDSTQSRIVLDWQYTPSTKNSTGKEWFIVYRASDGDALEQYESVNISTMTFQDRVNPSQKRTYRYAIAVTNGRSTSPLSQEAQMRVP